MQSTGIPAPDDSMPEELRKVLTELNRIARVVVSGLEDESNAMEEMFSEKISSEKEEEDLDPAVKEIVGCYPCDRTKFRWNVWYELNLPVFFSIMFRLYELKHHVRLSVEQIEKGFYDLQSRYWAWWFTVLCDIAFDEWNCFQNFA